MQSYYPLMVGEIQWEVQTAASSIGGEQQGHQQEIAKFLQEKVYQKKASEVSARAVMQKTGTGVWRVRAGTNHC